MPPVSSVEVEVTSMPAMPVHALSPIHSTHHPSPEPPDEQPQPELSRSASYTYLSNLSKDTPGQIKRTFSENILTLNSRKEKVSDSMQNANKELFRRASKKAKKRMSLSQSKFTLGPDDDDSDKRANGDGGEPRLSKSMTGTIRSLARKSWIGSRSSSPVEDDKRLDRKNSWSPAKKAGRLAADSIAVPERAASRSPSTDSREEDRENGRRSRVSTSDKSLLKAKRRSDPSPKRLSARSSMSSFRSFSSNDRQKRDPDVPPMPSISTEALSMIEKTRKKDPLWNAFRQIEGEYTTFQSKTSMQKAKVLRTVFIPFLIDNSQDQSGHALKPEDLDRRITILNKWWMGLLDTLQGSNNQILTGTDRPAFLEAVAQIMMRPEWRVPGFLGAEVDNPISVQQSNTSTTSTESEQLVETIHHNIRSIFVENLLLQIGYVIDKLCMRSAPASLVNFGGKTCAYAFVFCPGVAEMLVRLWRIAPGTLRRVFAEVGIERGDRLEETATRMASYLPAATHGLIFNTQSSLSRIVQLRKAVPPGTESFNWHGPWLGRWSGRDSDLFFNFTKFYHVLISDFLPKDLSAKEYACVPGFTPIYAQILIVLETTLYRAAGQQAVDNFASGAGGYDSADVLAPLPMTIANASRTINENRLVMLLRDVLGDAQFENSGIRELYADSFSNILKAAARKVSLYNNDACFILCDFLEEIFPILLRHYQSDTPFLDWPFWFKVCRQMMQSENTLTQIRLIAFVYSVWNIIIANEERKKEMVIDWLLDENIFHTHFCHWSPMVRHYYFRLICWRVARLDSDPSDLDLQICETLSTRLNEVWAHYQYLSAEADMRNLVQPSTAPCSPAPSRCLVIIRTDTQSLAAPSAFSSFDKFLSQGLLNQPNAYQKSSSVINSLPDPDTPQSNGTKKRWSLFKNMLPFGTPGNDRPGEVTPPQTPDDRRSVQANGQMVSRPATPPHQAFSFKFSLEWSDARQNATPKQKKLVGPTIPFQAQNALDEYRSASGDPKAREVKPLKPVGLATETSRYSGRALSEWAQVLVECRNFCVRRKQEGVPQDNMVETPTMGVETFRMMG